MTKFEKRTAAAGVEHRAGEGVRTLVGYASVFNSPADIGGWFTEVIAPGAFSLQLGADVRALVDHDSGRVIGRTKSGTLRLSEDAKGLKVEIDVPNTTDGNDLWELVERGDVNSMSFGFRVLKETWDETVDPPLRTVHEVELMEVSAVAWPAYEDTELGKRSLQQWREANKVEEPIIPEITNSAAASDNQAAANLKRRLSMDLDLKVRAKR